MAGHRRATYKGHTDTHTISLTSHTLTLCLSLSNCTKKKISNIKYSNPLFLINEHDELRSIHFCLRFFCIVVVGATYCSEHR